MSRLSRSFPASCYITAQHPGIALSFDASIKIYRDSNKAELKFHTLNVCLFLFGEIKTLLIAVGEALFLHKPPTLRVPMTSACGIS